MVTPTDYSLPRKHGRAKSSPYISQLDNECVLVNIVLGMPKQRCQYHGICRMDIDDVEDNHCSPKIKANIRYKSKQIHIQFWKEKISEVIAEQHFASGYFIVLTDFTLPESLQAIFNTSLVIRRGIYPVRESEDYYTVYF